MRYKQINFITNDEIEYLTIRKDNQMFVINKNGRYIVGILDICGNKYRVEGEPHLFTSIRDALDCLLENVLV